MRKKSRAGGAEDSADNELDLEPDADDDDDPADEDVDEDSVEEDSAREAADKQLIDELDNDDDEADEEDDSRRIVVSPEDERKGKLALKKVCISPRVPVNVQHIHTLRQITQLSKKIWHSPPIRAELSKLAHEAKLNSEVLLRSVATRWNTVTEVLERALGMRDVLGDLCDKYQFNKPQGVRLRRFALTDKDWELISQLYQLLHVRLPGYTLAYIC